MFQKIKRKVNQILNICFNLLHLKYCKYKLKNEIYFLILPKYNSKQIQQLQHWCSKCSSKEIVYRYEMGKQIKSSLLTETLLQ